MIDILSQIYSHIESPYDIHSLMSVNQEFYSLSEKWRKDNWDFYGLPLMPWQVNLPNHRIFANIRTKEYKFDMPPGYELTLLNLSKTMGMVILVANKNMKKWVNIIKNVLGKEFYNDDPTKSQVLINHTSVSSHRKSNIISMFKNTRLLISTPSAYTSLRDVHTIRRLLIFDYDASDIPVKYNYNRRVIRMVENAKYKYVDRYENFAPTLNITRMEPGADLIFVIDGFKNNKSIYIVSTEELEPIIVGKKLIKIDNIIHAFLDNEVGGNIIYEELRPYNARFIPCDNVIIHAYNYDVINNLLTLMRKLSPSRRDINVVIMYDAYLYLSDLFDERHIHDSLIYTNPDVIYGLCKAMGYEPKTLNNQELIILFGKYSAIDLDIWKQQPDNKFTENQINIIMSVRK